MENDEQHPHSPTSGSATTRRASVSRLKARLSEYLRLVRGGGEVVVTDRGRPVARLSPIDVTGDPGEFARTLVARGLAREPRHALPPDFWDLPRPDDPEGRAVRAVLEERAEDR